VTTVALAFRVLISLTVVVAILWGASRMLRKKAGLGGRAARGDMIQVLARRGLQKNISVAVVQVGQSILVLGVTEHNVTLLSGPGPGPGPGPLSGPEAAGPTGIDLTESDRGGASAQSDLSTGWTGLEYPGDGGTPSQEPMVPAGASSSTTAWKLLINSLREHTVRR
jgi:flagellar protein FliO/FliZ